MIMMTKLSNAEFAISQSRDFRVVGHASVTPTVERPKGHQSMIIMTKLSNAEFAISQLRDFELWDTRVSLPQ
jgi:hypothetical protein